MTPQSDPSQRAGMGAHAMSDHPWVTMVWNDPVNLMNYVTYVFQVHFGLSEQDAARHMLEVHEHGASVLSAGTQEQMERDVQAMHGYGLWATLQRSEQ